MGYFMSGLLFLVFATNSERAIISTPIVRIGCIRSCIMITPCPSDGDGWLVNTRIRLPAGNTKIVCWSFEVISWGATFMLIMVEDFGRMIVEGVFVVTLKVIIRRVDATRG